MSRSWVLVCVSSTGFWLSGAAVASECPADLANRADVADAANPAGYDYDVYYTEEAGHPEFFSAERAQWVSDALLSSHQEFVNLGFDPPLYSVSPNDTCIHDIEVAANGRAEPRRTEIDAPNLVSEEEMKIRSVVLHEQFHHVQYSRLNYDERLAWGEWVFEGMATVMEDKVFADLDQSIGSAFFLEAQRYNEDGPLTGAREGHAAALFWMYFTEQVGSPLPEPGYGVDAIVRYLELAGDSAPDGFGVLERTLNELGFGDRVEDFFTNFAISLYVHNRDLTRLPSRDLYRYVDESPIDCVSDCVLYRSANPTLVPMNSGLSDEAMAVWSVRHFESDVPETTQTCQVVGVHAKAKGDRPLGWAVVGRRDQQITDVHRARGREFYRALVNPPSDNYTKLALVAAGLNDSEFIDVNFGSGPMTSEVRLPTQERPALVGALDEAPRRFLMRLRVTGPANLTPSGVGPVSVKGLDPTQFEVRLASSSTGTEYTASILQAMYVDGEYWLSVLPPSGMSPSDGLLYDLKLCPCPGVGSCPDSVTSVQAVRFEDEVLHQMLTIDRSYSMHYPEPAETAKITAAKQAALLYVDAAQDDDLLGIATFNGNNTECDHDAQLTPRSAGLVPVATRRDDLSLDIRDIVEDGWTSIGDGIKTSRDALLSGGSGSPADVRGIVLLSDGLENEEDFWESPSATCGEPAVQDSFDMDMAGVAAGIRIDTIAFGADADERLMERIAAATNGLALPVSTQAPEPVGMTMAGLRSAVSGSRQAPDSASLEVPNRLAAAYRTIQEDTRHQNRLFFAKSELVAGGADSLTIDVTEASGGGVQDSVFTVGWHLASANVGVELFDPSGALVTSTTSGWRVTRGATHVTFHYSGVLPTGAWQVALTSDASVQAVVMLSGRIVHGVDLETRTSQVRGVGPNTECERQSYRYLRGLPVTLLAALSDARGGIGNAEVEAVVHNPDGTSNTVTLHDDGAHEDSLPGDGVYGGVYTRTPFFSRGGVPDFPAGPPSGTWGSYSVEISASGVSGFGEPFSRHQQRGFHIYEFDPSIDNCAHDDDNDGLPNRWERLYGLDPADGSDAVLDHDGDGLSAQEEFQYGTLPLNADTDGAGESDGSEVGAGRDPLYDQDDLLAPIREAQVISHLYHPVQTDVLRSEANLLRFSVPAGSQLMHVFRTDPSWSGFQQVATLDVEQPPRGLYYDEGLSNGVRYDYYLVAEGLSGAHTAPSHIFDGTPKADPVPPLLWASLNDGSPTTTSTSVTLKLNTSPDVTEMLVSEDPSFAAAVWQPFASSVPLTLASSPNLPHVASVYAKVRDADGHESVVAADAITIEASTSCNLKRVPVRGGLGWLWLVGIALGWRLRRRGGLPVG